MAKRNTQQPEQFNGVPGMGTLLFKRSLTHGMNLWQGPMMTLDKRHITIEALGNAQTGYDCKVKEPREGEQWKLLATFHMPSFAGTRKPIKMRIDELGNVVIYQAKTRNQEPCVRIQCVSAVAF